MMKKLLKNSNFWILIVIVIMMVGIFSFVGQSDFGGSDGKAEDLIGVVDPGYKVWFTNIWEPPGSEIESLLFALQAAIGAGVLFYVLGYYRGKKAQLKQD